MASRILRFGTYDLPTGFKVVGEPLPSAVGVAKLPRADGARTVTGYLDRKVVEVSGGIIRGPFDGSDWRTRVDALRAGLSGTQNLYLWDDRYYRDMQCERVDFDYAETGFGRIGMAGLTFVGPDPFQYSTSLDTDTWSSPTNGGTRSLSAGGNDVAYAKYSFTVGGSGTQLINWTLTNNGSGRYFVLNGSVTGGNVIVVDTALKTVTISSADEMDLFEGEFFPLTNGSNTLGITITTGSISSIASEWRARWRG